MSFLRSYVCCWVYDVCAVCDPVCQHHVLAVCELCTCVCVHRVFVWLCAVLDLSLCLCVCLCLSVCLCVCFYFCVYMCVSCLSAHPVSLCLAHLCVCVCVCTCVCAHVCVRVPFPGDLSPPHEHTCLSDEDKQRGGAQVGVAQTKDCGTSTDGPCRRGHAPVTTGTRSKLQDRKPPPPPPPPQDYAPAPLRPRGGGAEDRIHYTTDVCLEPTEEIYLTPVLRSSESLHDHAHDHAHAQDQPDLPPSQQPEHGRMSLSSDTEGPPPYQPLPDRTNPCISEEDEVYVAPPPSYASCMEALATPPAPLGGPRAG